jgi:2-oxoglutarate ferredoxin oxidoreductase subunit gamma
MIPSTNRYEIRLAGKGGQGMVLAGQILATAAAVYDGKEAVQSQSYGPEARGGASKSEVIISDEPIDYPKVISADLLLVMSQEACDMYYYDLKQDGILIADSAEVQRVPTTRCYRVPITQIAEQATDRRITASIVALGLIVGLTEVVSRRAIERAVLERVPKGTEEINVRALEAGLDYAKRLERGETIVDEDAAFFEALGGA